VRAAQRFQIAGDVARANAKHAERGEPLSPLYSSDDEHNISFADDSTLEDEASTQHSTNAASQTTGRRPGEVPLGTVSKRLQDYSHVRSETPVDELLYAPATPSSQPDHSSFSLKSLFSRLQQLYY
jgi:hypothetical protein